MDLRQGPSLLFKNGDGSSPTYLAGLLSGSNEKMEILRDKTPQHYDITRP